jgi:hypothetical protein
MEDVFRPRRRPRSEETMIQISEGSAATKRDEARARTCGKIMVGHPFCRD